MFPGGDADIVKHVKGIIRYISQVQIGHFSQAWCKTSQSKGDTCLSVRFSQCEIASTMWKYVVNSFKDLLKKQNLSLNQKGTVLLLGEERKSEQAHIPHAATLPKNAVYNVWAIPSISHGQSDRKPYSSELHKIILAKVQRVYKLLLKKISNQHFM